MEGCSLPLFLLLLVGGGAALLRLRRRLQDTEERVAELDLGLQQLSRQLAERAFSPGVEEPPEGLPGEPVAVAPEAPASELEALVAVPEPPVLTEPEAPEPAEPPPSLPTMPESAWQPTAMGPGVPEAEPGESSVAPPPVAAAPPAPPRERLKIDWERWVGVRGAAVLGGVVLALAAVLFLKFSIERGLIPPTVRVTLGVLAGMASIVGAEVLRKRKYGAAADALSGAGIVILYASIWAARVLYELVPMAPAFAFMILVTVVCGLLSWRHRSLVIALLGLIGGFATPLLLAAGQDRPIGLFGYILLLDVALLTLARKRDWPLLGLLGLGGTLLFQVLWIFNKMGPDSVLLGLGIVGVFALLFAANGSLRPAGDAGEREWRLTGAAGTLLPFMFAVYFAGRADLGLHLYPVAALLVVLSAAACWMARVHALPLLASAAAAGGVAVVAVWTARTTFTEPLAWELAGVVVVLALLFYLFERFAAPRQVGEAALESLAGALYRPSLVAAGGLLLVLVIAFPGAGGSSVWPWLAAWIGLTALLRLAMADPPRGYERLVLPAAAAVQVAAFLIRAGATRFTDRLAWETAGAALILALFYHLFVRRQGGDGDRMEPPAAAAQSAQLIAAAGLFVVLILGPVLAGRTALWPWLAGWVGLTVLLLIQGRVPARGYRQVLAGLLLALGFLAYLADVDLRAVFPEPWLFFGLVLAAAVAFQALALWRRGSPVGLTTELAAAVYALVLLLGVVVSVDHPALGGGLYLAVTFALAGLVALTATRLPSGPLYFIAVASLGLAHVAWTAESAEPANALAGLLTMAAAVLLFTFWPFAAGRRPALHHLVGDRWAVYASALAGPFWFLPMKRLFELRFGDGAIGALPIALAVVALLAALAARRLWSDAPAERLRGLVWYLAVTFAFVSVAIPLQLEKEWVTVGWALEGLALIALWKRLDHPGLKVLGLALLAAVTARLIANPAVLGYYPRSGWPIFNWLMYTYLVPAAALLLAARILERLEIERLLAWEKRLYALVKRRPVGAIACALAAILVVFVWINLTVVDYFSTGKTLDLTFARQPARDLTLSLAWAVYALILLAIGMARKSVALRWLSLGFLILTIGKVFLYDLGELKDLYRVASLVGLAVSLILVSLAYQRFVFGRDKEEEP